MWLSPEHSKNNDSTRARALLCPSPISNLRKCRRRNLEKPVRRRHDVMHQTTMKRPPENASYPCLRAWISLSLSVTHCPDPAGGFLVVPSTTNTELSCPLHLLAVVTVSRHAAVDRESVPPTELVSYSHRRGGVGWEYTRGEHRGSDGGER